MHWNEIQGCLVLGFSAHNSNFSVNLLYCPFLAVSLLRPIQIAYDTNHMRISDTELSRPCLSCFCRVVGVMTRHSELLGTIGSDNSFRIILYFSKDFEEQKKILVQRPTMTVIYCFLYKGN